MNKLDYLAQKEEELRKLNEQLDSRKTDLLQQEEEPKKDIFANNAWTVNNVPEQPPEEEDKYEEEKYEDQPDDDALHEVQNYQEVLEKSKEQQKIINIQKAKIQALQAELEDAIKKMNM